MPGNKSKKTLNRTPIEQCLQRCPTPELQDILLVAAEAALAAGDVLQDLYDRPHQIRHKGTIDLVTEADLASETVILKLLQERSPGIRILSEESHGANMTGSVEPFWIIDPLDGTTNFAHNFPWFAVSIALYESGGSQAGVIYSPMQAELFCGVRGAGAWLNDQPITVSGIAALQEALLATGFPYDVAKRPDSILAVLREIVIRSQGVRRPGAAALDLAYLACGRLDGFWEVGLKPWDTAAGSLLLEEAGGTLSDFRGNPFSPYIPELLASNSLLHEELTTLLARFSSLAP